MPNQGPMRPDELIEPDLLDEIVLLGSGIVLFLALLLIVVAAFARTLH